MPATLFQAHVLLAALDRCCTGMASNAPSGALKMIACTTPTASLSLGRNGPEKIAEMHTSLQPFLFVTLPKISLIEVGIKLGSYCDWATGRIAMPAGHLCGYLASLFRMLKDSPHKGGCIATGACMPIIPAHDGDQPCSGSNACRAVEVRVKDTLLRILLGLLPGMQ